MLRFTSVSKAFDGRPALVDVTFGVPAGSRTAVVGVNGSGKSTLLRIAVGALAPDRGAVALAPGATVTHVPQDYALLAGRTVEAYLRERAGVAGLERRLRELERALADGEAGAADAYAGVLDRYAALGGYEVDGRIERALGRLGLPPVLLHRELGTLSGGQQVRVGLAGVLASRFDVYLLDEPTNNLDLPALDLLEEFVATASATFLLVAHDRAFLDTVATDVVELDEHRHTAEVYGVAYAEYRTLRERALARRSSRYRAYAAEVDRLQAAAAGRRASAAATTDLRPARDNDKFARHFFAQRSAEQAARAARRIERRLARLEEVEGPRGAWELRLSLAAGSRSGDRVVRAEGVRAILGSFRLGPLSLDVGWRERLAIHGHNGAGKSLLLGLLTGAREPDAGQVRVGAGVRFGVLRQGGADLAGADSALAVFRRALGWTESEARTLLAKFDLGADHVLRAGANLSPGERCRLGLAILVAQEANCLVLDEPTNHLDLEAQEQLEQALTTFDGTLLVVSHDREFLARVGVTRRVTLHDGHLVEDRLTSS
jgi:ATPase subunit of ABC transporter with duplicated ATPase domains